MLEKERKKFRGFLLHQLINNIWIFPPSLSPPMCVLLKRFFLPSKLLFLNMLFCQSFFISPPPLPKYMIGKEGGYLDVEEFELEGNF